MKNLISQKDFPIEPPIKVKIFQDYNKLDRDMVKVGYSPTEPREDTTIDTNGYVGIQNSRLHSGWIATMGDSSHHVEDQIRLLNEKVKICIEMKEKVKVGFCQTGHFSIGYTIYVKN